MDKTQIDDFKTQLFAAAQTAGFSAYEIYYAGGVSFSAKVRDQQVEEYKNTASSGLSFRGLYQGNMGYAYSEHIDPSAIDFIVNAARDNATIKENNDEHLFAGSEHYPHPRPISDKLDEPTSDQKIAWLKTMEAHAKTLDPRVQAVDYCFISSGTGDVYIANSHGLNLYRESGNATSYIGVRVSEGESVKVGFKVWRGHDFDTYDPKAVAAEAVERAINMLGAKSIPTGDYAVIIENRGMVALLSTFMGNFFAESVQKGFSLLKDKVGTAIASPNITIHDNLAHPLSFSQATFDSEGVAVRDKVVVDKGVLKTYLYNLKAAHVEGRESTGNGYKPSFKASVNTDINNFFIAPGETAIDQLMGDFTGVVIDDFMGLHAGANTTSGDFSLQANGFLYEKGQLVHAVEQITLAGNFYELLKQVDTVADDLYFSPWSTVGSPSLLVSGLKISGEGHEPTTEAV